MADFVGSPWWSKATWQMGPAIVVLFVLLWVVISPLKNVKQEHVMIMGKQDDTLYQAKLSNHFLWAKCVNDASILQDKAEREMALERCIPPIEKAPNTKDQSYLFEKNAFASLKDIVSKVPQVLAKPLHFSIPPTN